MKTFKPGDRVKFSREFLRNTGQITGPAPFAKGTVVEVKSLRKKQYVTVKWDAGYGMPETSGALSVNLVLENKPELAV